MVCLAIVKSVFLCVDDSLFFVFVDVGGATDPNDYFLLVSFILFFACVNVYCLLVSMLVVQNIPVFLKNNFM
jgi:hypothetical protein